MKEYSCLDRMIFNLIFPESGKLIKASLFVNFFSRIIKMKLLVTLLLSFLFLITSGNNSKDSLLLDLAQSDSDTTKVNKLLMLADNYYYTDLSFAEKTYRSALYLSEKLNYERGVAEAEYALGRFYSESEYDLSAYFIYKALPYFEAEKDSGSIANCYNILGIIKSKINDFDKSLNNLFHAEKIYEEIKDTHSLVKINNNIGLIYTELGKDSLAIQYFENAEKLNESSGNVELLAIIYGNMGEIYSRINALTKAECYYHKALSLTDETGNISIKAWILSKIGRLKLMAGEYDSCFFYTNWSIKLVENSGWLSNLDKSYAIMKEYYMFQGDYKMAFRYLEKENIIKDSLFDKDQVKKMAMQEMRFQFEKDKKVQSLRYNAQKFKFLTIILSLIVLVILVVSILLILKARQKKIRAQNEKLNIEKKRLEELMQVKSRELTSQLLQLANKNELNFQLVKKLRKAKLNFKKENLNLINSIINDLSINANENIWASFSTSFNEVHPNFMKNIRNDFPNLTHKEQRLAAFLFLNLSSKEIAAITHISVTSVEIARVRLRKKLGISGEDVIISGFLSKYL